jgi:FkbH-like protein
MKDTIALDRPVARLTLAADAAAGLADTRRRIAARSQIVWGEHCTECAAPACYTACAFYTPRADGHCRRFVNGIEAVDAPGLAPRAASRILFRKWGKLEGRGPLRAFAPGAADARERSDRFWSGLLAQGLGGPAVARRMSWELTQKKRAGSEGSPGLFDAFVIEGQALGETPHAFTLTIVPQDKRANGLFQIRFALERSWSRIVTPVADIARGIDLDQPFLIQIEPVGEAEGVDVLIGLAEFVRWAPGAAPAAPPAPARPARRAKVVVWDLDHTVWDGILLEDGATGVALRPGVREAMEALDARGILQSVASKNNVDEALAALAHHGIADFLLAPQIGWGPKSASLQRLAEILNLGIDSFVFIDDQPFERGEVGEAHPSVTVLPETAVDGLLQREIFDVPVTPESRGRRALYRVEAERAAAAQIAGGDPDAFLRGCRLVLTVERLAAADVERVYELSQRTNQLNVAATRYERDEVAAMADGREAGDLCLTLRCADRFGDYGLIGFVRARPSEGRIVDFFMSCRVQRKRVEAAFFAWLAGEMIRAGARQITARHTAAARNAPAVEMFEDLGFTLTRDGDGGWLTRSTDAPFAGSDIVTVSAPAAPAKAEAA